MKYRDLHPFTGETFINCDYCVIEEASGSALPCGAAAGADPFAFALRQLVLPLHGNQ